MPNTHVLVGRGAHKVLALHGWFGHAAGWGGLPAVLDGDRHSYAFMDARGYGGMKDSAGPWTMEQVAADALALADHLGWRRFSVMGHSMAGVAIQRLWLAAPERVRALLAISPVSAAGVAMDAQEQALFDAAAREPAARRTIIDITTGSRLSASWLDRMVQNSLVHSSEAAVAGYFRSWSGARFVEQVRRQPQPPVLVLPGEHDPALGEAACRDSWLAHYPDASLAVLRNAGHYPMDELPVLLATTLERFLADVPA